MNKIIYSLIIALVISAGAVSLNNKVSGDLQNGLIRLHIIADSDSERAQDVKLKVRDAVLNNVDPNDKDFLKKAEAEAERVLRRSGEAYGAKAYYGRFYFPKKEYENVTLPKGEYYSVRLVLGRGSGRNWWCIMYPPMCAVHENEMELTKASAEVLKRTLTPESYELITAPGGKVKLKFKTVEIIQSIKRIFVK